MEAKATTIRTGLSAAGAFVILGVMPGVPSAQAAPRRAPARRTTSRSQLKFYRMQNARQRQQLRRQQTLLQRQQGQSRQKQEEASLEWQAMMLGELDGKVGLSEQQKAEVKPLLAAEAKQISALGNTRNLSAQERQDQLAQLGDATWTKVDKLLTPEQKLKLEEDQQDQKLERLAKLLGLSDDQKDKIGALLDDEAKQAEDVKDDKSLSADAQKTQLKTIDDGTWEKIEPILTTNQQQKLDQVRQDEMLQDLTKALTLTTTEKDRIKPILEAAAQQIHTARAAANLVEPAKEDKQQQIRDNMWSQVRQQLTTTQQKKLDQLLTTGKVTAATAGRGVTPRARRNKRNRP